MLGNVRSSRAELFWVLHSLPRWEQKVFLAVNAPFQVVNVLLSFILFIPFQIIIILRLPFFILILCTSLFWMLCLAIILTLSFISERIPALRPFTFILVLPFLIIAHNLNSLIPAPGPKDFQAKIDKWDLVEAFPLTLSLLRFNIDDEPLIP